MGKLYRISEVAGLMGIHPKTLRYYEEQGILTPTHVDGRTGYRYYDQHAILFLWQLLVMREAGMESKAKAIVFSLPVTDTAGLRLVEAEEE